MKNYNNIPNEMKQLKRWVLWKIKVDEKGKTTKIPINANNGYGAKTNDSSTWVSFNEALSKVDFYNCKGIGFMLGNGYFGVDIDNAIEDKELIEEFVKALNSYTEVSQSGKGIHIICKGVLPLGARRKGNIEMYDNARFKLHRLKVEDLINDYEQLKKLREEIQVKYFSIYEELLAEDLIEGELDASIWGITREHENEVWDSELRLLSDIKTNFDIGITMIESGEAEKSIIGAENW